MNPRFVFPPLLTLLALAGRATGQVERQKIEGSGLQQGDNFGSAVAVSGDWAVVGAPSADDLGINSGAAYVFERIAGVWVEQQRIKASDAAANAGFGGSVDIEGTTIAVGAPSASYQGIQYVGAIYILENVGGVWTETQKLEPNDAALNYGLGYPVALSGNRVIGGATGESHAGPHTGAAYIFESTAGSWSQVAKVIANDGAAGDDFGYSVGLHGDIALVGAVGAYNGLIDNVGAVYVYELQGSLWPQTQKLTPPNPSRTQLYGCCVGANQDSLLVGASNNHYAVSGGGAVFVYQHPASTWDQTQVLVPADIADADGFGASLSTSGDCVVIGSHSSDLAWATGSIYLFHEVGSVWSETAKGLASDGQPGDVMGNAVGLDANTALAGTPSFDGACPTLPSCDSGAAYFFEFAPGATQYGSCGSGAPCANSDGHGGCRNSTGQGGVLGAFGTNSVAADDLVLEARWLPPSVNAIAFMGRGSTSVILGDGLRVAAPGFGSSLYRFSVHPAGADGVLQYGPGLVASTQSYPPAGQIQSGQTWNFQVWYRNVGGPCGSGSNTTNGLSVTFAP